MKIKITSLTLLNFPNIRFARKADHEPASYFYDFKPLIERFFTSDTENKIQLKT